MATWSGACGASADDAKQSGTAMSLTAAMSVGNATSYLGVRFQNVTVTLNSSYTPLVVLVSGGQTYRVQPTIENQTTGESITIDAAVDVDESIEIDVANHQVTRLSDDTDAYNAVTTVEGVRRWILRLQAGSNTLSYTQSGLVEVDVDIVFERRYRV